MEVSENLSDKVLTIGFARRFATYKRAHLLFNDLDRLNEIVNNPERPVQFLFAGKAHPHDGGGQGLIKRITEVSKMPQFLGKILFLQNYDMELAKKWTRERKLASIPVSAFYNQRTDHKVLRFCFAKSDETLIRGAEILNAIE